MKRKWKDLKPLPTKEELLKENMKKLPFPEHLVQDMAPESKQMLRDCWSGDLEEFCDNIEKKLGIRLNVDISDPKDP